MALFRKKPDPVSERAKDLDHKIAELQAQIRKLSEQNEPGAAPSAQPGQPGAGGPSPRQSADRPARAARETAESRDPGHRRSPSAPPNPEPKGLAPKPPSAIPNFTTPAKGGSAPAHPRLRSTTLPQRTAEGPGAHDPIFEDLNQPEISAEATPPPAAPEDLGTRKSDLASLWQRLLRHVRGPVTSNPKLVNYLAAGSIQGLQPLRYEKRVARNRFIVFAAFLVLALWGLIVMLSRR